MIHGKLGYIDSDRLIHVAPELLEHGFTQKRSKMYGVLYPRPDDDNVEVVNNLVLTSIPFRLWPLSARGSIHLRNKPKQIQEVARYLQGERDLYSSRREHLWWIPV